ncbi:putative ligand-binding protein with streptavidin-like fold [Streptomyces sp. Ag109_O5-1]|nr:putative ligand-binding protein with streptavidin-like fold [Streptomyces sp. Ag109_O5-1]
MTMAMTMTITDTDTDTVSWNLEALDAMLSNDERRPVLFTNDRILTIDPLIGARVGADILFVGPLIVGVGPGIVTAAGDDNAIVVGATGTTVVMDAIAPAGGRGHRSEYVATLAPGNTTNFLVVPDELADDLPSAVATLLAHPERVRALVSAGRPVLWAGTDVPGRATAPETGIPDAENLTGSPCVGVWIDRNDFLHQELSADGRYDETGAAARTPTRAATGSTASASATWTTSASGPTASSSATNSTTRATS